MKIVPTFKCSHNSCCLLTWQHRTGPPYVALYGQPLLTYAALRAPSNLHPPSPCSSLVPRRLFPEKPKENKKQKERKRQTVRKTSVLLSYGDQSHGLSVSD
jgi:hypothetical protein